MKSRLTKSFFCLLLVVSLQLGCASIQKNEKTSLGSLANNIDLQFGHARMQERNKNFESAMNGYKSIVEHTEHAPSFHRMAVISIRLGDLTQALKYFERSMNLEAANAELLGDLGYTHYLAGNLQEAENYLRQAANMDPGSERIANNLGLVVGKQQKFSEAITHFRRTNSEAESQANLGFVKSQIGELQQAASHYHRALQLDPKLRVAAHALVQIDPLITSREMQTDMNSARTAPVTQPPVRQPRHYAKTTVAKAPAPEISTSMPTSNSKVVQVRFEEPVPQQATLRPVNRLR